MTQLDLLIVRYLNGMAHTFAPFDRLIYLIANSHLLKGGVLIAIL